MTNTNKGRTRQTNRGKNQKKEKQYAITANSGILSYDYNII